MNIPVLQMEKPAARKAFLEYRRAVRDRHNKEDEMIMRGYRAMSLGSQLIDLHQVMRAAGVDSLNRPCPGLSLGVKSGRRSLTQ